MSRQLVLGYLPLTSLAMILLSSIILSSGCATASNCKVKAEDGTCKPEPVLYRPTEEEAAHRGYLPSQPLVDAVRESREERLSLDAPKNAVARAEIQYVKGFGPGSLLTEVILSPAKDGSKLVGYRIDELSDSADAYMRRFEDRLVVGDIIVNINSIPIKNPDDLMKVWDQLDQRSTIEFDLVRDYGEDGPLFHKLSWPVVD